MTTTPRISNLKAVIVGVSAAAALIATVAVVGMTTGGADDTSATTAPPEVEALPDGTTIEQITEASREGTAEDQLMSDADTLEAELAAGRELVQAALSDGAVSDSEYRESVERVHACLERRGFSVSAVEDTGDGNFNFEWEPPDGIDHLEGSEVYHACFEAHQMGLVGTRFGG